MDKVSGQDTTSKDVSEITMPKSTTESHMNADSKEYSPDRKSEIRSESRNNITKSTRQIEKDFTSYEREQVAASLDTKIVKTLKEEVQLKAVQKGDSESSVSDEKSGRFEKLTEEMKELETRQEFIFSMESEKRIQTSESPTESQSKSQSQTQIESQLREGDGESSPDFEIKSLQSQPKSIKNAISESPLLMQQQKQIAEMEEKVTLSAVLEFQDESFDALKSKKDLALQTPPHGPRVKFQSEIEDSTQQKQRPDKTPYNPSKQTKLEGQDKSITKLFIKPILQSLKLNHELSDEINTEANKATPEIKTPKSKPPVHPLKSEPKHDYFDRSGYDLNLAPGLSGKNTPHQLIEGLRVESPNKSMMDIPYMSSSHWDHNLSESIQRQNNLFTAQITAMHNELESQQLTNNELLMKLNSFDRETMLIGKNILSTEMEIKQLKSDNRILENELKRHEQNLKVADLEYKDYQNAIQETTRKTDEYKLKIYKLNEDRTAYREEKNGLEHKLATKQEEVSRLEHELEYKKINSEKERTDNSNLTQDLSRKKKQLEEQRKKLKAELEKTRADYEDRVHKQERSFIDTLNEQKYQNKEKLMNLKYKGIDLEAKLNMKSIEEDKLSERFEKVENKRKKIKDLKYKIQRHKDQNEDNTFNLRALESKKKFSFLLVGFYIMLGLIVCSILNILVKELR